MVVSSVSGVGVGVCVSVVASSVSSAVTVVGVASLVVISWVQWLGT